PHHRAHLLPGQLSTTRRTAGELAGDATCECRERLDQRPGRGLPPALFLSARGLAWAGPLCQLRLHRVRDFGHSGPLRPSETIADVPECLQCQPDLRPWAPLAARGTRSEEHTSELQSPYDLVCRLLLEKKKKKEK